MEILNQVFIMDGKKRNSIQQLVAGDIGATLKLKHTNTCDTLYGTGNAVSVRPIRFPEPRMRMAVEAANKSEDEKLTETLRKLHEQDQTMVVNYSRELRQLIMGTQGELHQMVVDWTLKHLYGLHINFIKPRIPYRETIQRSANAVYRHKKQSGGAGQFGEVHMHIEPYFEGMEDPEGYNIRKKTEVELEWGGKLVFYNCIVGGAIDAKFLPSVQKGVMETMERGPLTSSFVRDVVVMVYDGKMHQVDSNDMSFKIAGAQAFKSAFLEAQPKLLEPVQELEVLVPEELMGDVMTDLQSRRAIIQGMDSVGKYQSIKARVPLAELYKYSTTLRSITQGRGSFSSKFAAFGLVPGNVQETLIQQQQVEA
ncbi:MAG: hypothetical protein AAGB22_02665 [Bacteroidota bacterium]